MAQKELKRQLARERERHQNTEQKYKEAKSEADRLRVLLMEQPAISQNSETMAKLTSLRVAFSSEKVHHHSNLLTQLFFFSPFRHLYFHFSVYLSF